MTLGFRHTPKQRQTLALNQKLVLGLRVLEMTQREVDAAVETLEEQSLVDAVPSAQGEQVSIETNEDTSDETTPEHSSESDRENEANDFISGIGQAGEGAMSRGSGDPDWTPEDYLTAPPDFRERILAQLNEGHLPEQQQRIAAFLVEALDSRGFFTEDMEECAKACGVDVANLHPMLVLIQRCEPVGVGARNAWDAIRLFLERNGCAATPEWHIASCMSGLIETGELREITAGASLVMPHADCESVILELSKVVAGRLGLSEAHVRHTLQRLLKVVPHPVDQHEEEVTPWQDHHLQSTDTVGPDVAISLSPAGSFSVELYGSRYANLSISKTLLVEIDDLKKQLESFRAAKHLPGEAGAHAKDKIVDLTIKREQKEECKEHVMQFLRACEDRRTTLLRVATLLAHSQKAFLTSGSIYDLKCLSPENAGSELELEEFGGQSLSESTVSRAVQDKFVRLPNGEVKPLKLLCSPGEKASNTDGQEVRYLPDIVQEWIMNFIRHEDRAHPMSDEQIAKAIEREEDLILSRKTIENYRKELEIPSARERKRKGGNTSLRAG